MQKNSSQLDRYVRGIWRKSVANLIGGVVVIFVIGAVRLVSGCEPILPEQSNEETKTLSEDSTETDNTITPNPEINDWDKDSTVYHSTTQPAGKRCFSLK